MGVIIDYNKTRFDILSNLECEINNIQNTINEKNTNNYNSILLCMKLINLYEKKGDVYKSLNDYETAHESYTIAYLFSFNICSKLSEENVSFYKMQKRLEGKVLEKHYKSKTIKFALELKKKINCLFDRICLLDGYCNIDDICFDMLRCLDTLAYQYNYNGDYKKALDLYELAINLCDVLGHYTKLNSNIIEYYTHKRDLTSEYVSYSNSSSKSLK